jgi:hypothetical protein
LLAAVASGLATGAPRSALDGARSTTGKEVDVEADIAGKSLAWGIELPND